MNLLQRFRILPLEHQRFGIWRSLCLSLATGLLLNRAWASSGRGASLSDLAHLGIELALLLPAWLMPLLWNRRAVALGAPGFWAVWAPRWRSLTLSTVVVAVLTSLALNLEGRRAEQAWREVEDQLRQRGEPLSYQELMGLPIPAEQNFAAHPFLSGIHAYTRTQDGQGRSVSRWTGEARLTEIEHSLRFPHETEKTAGRPLRRDGHDLEALASLLKARTNSIASATQDPKDGPSSPVDPWSHLPIPPADMPAPQAVLFALEGLRNPLEQVAEAARRPDCHYDIPSNELVLPSLNHVARYKFMANKLLANRFSLRAAARLSAGDTSGAAEDIETLLRLADHSGKDPWLECYLVRWTLQLLAFHEYWEGTSRHAWSDHQLAAFQQRFEGLTSRDSMLRWLRGERLLRDFWFERMRQRRLNPHTLGPDEGDQFSGGLVPTAWLLQNQAHHSRTMARLINAVQRSDPNRGLGARGSVWETEGLEPWILDTSARRGHPYRILFDPLSLDLAHRVRKTDKCLSISRLATTVAALERYRLGTGGYPKTLGDLVPRFLEGVPLDPMDGQPLRYRVNADGTFTLYSVGPNHTDDGGFLSKGKDTEPADWVWPSNQPTDERRLF